MGLLSTIDGLLVFARYLAWAIAVVCVPISLVLVCMNLPLGIGSAAVFLAALLLAAGLAVLLMPRVVAERIKGIEGFRIPAVVLCVVAVALMGITYALSGGFPEINLLFA